MNLNDLKSLTRPQAEILETDDWTVERLAAATIADLTAYTGIGRVTANKVITEAINLVNTGGLEEADRLARERYYQKTPDWKVLEDWEKEGLPLKEVALASTKALVALKGIDDDLAAHLIGKAQRITNEQELYKSRAMQPAPPQVSIGGGSSAFPVEWLTGEAEPPPMGVRQQRIFEAAKKAHEDRG